MSNPFSSALFKRMNLIRTSIESKQHLATSWDLFKTIGILCCWQNCHVNLKYTKSTRTWCIGSIVYLIAEYKTQYTDPYNLICYTQITLTRSWLDFVESYDNQFKQFLGKELFEEKPGILMVFQINQDMSMNWGKKIVWKLDAVTSSNIMISLLLSVFSHSFYHSFLVNLDLFFFYFNLLDFVWSLW